jgi:hypothetical protein
MSLACYLRLNDCCFGKAFLSLLPTRYAEVLGLPTIWVPHSYAGCSQHAPDEHVLAPVCRDALRIMAGLWWDLGDGGTPWL